VNTQPIAKVGAFLYCVIWRFITNPKEPFAAAFLPTGELCGIFVRFQVFDKLPDDLVAFILRFI
jgi:hypothetical protein